MAVGFGIVGAGMISGLHGEALRSSPKAELVAVCDVVEARGEKLADEYALDAHVYTKLHDMLEISPLEEMVVVGDPGPQVKEMLAELGAKFYTPHVGISR